MTWIKEKMWYLLTQTILKHRFKSIGKRSLVLSPLQLDDCNSIVIESDVYIAQKAWLMGNDAIDYSLTIKRDVTIGHFVHIIAKSSITIEENVLIADKVFISDCTHNYEDINVPVKQQNVTLIKPVIIGEGSWLGENVCVLGACIGKHCVIGANSVVTKDIPDYCVATGNPARVIKKFDFERNEWVRM